MTPIIDMQQIRKSYGVGTPVVTEVLHGIDLQIARGATVGLLGRNGMGKSTLIRTLLGHVTQRSGRIASSSATSVTIFTP